MNVLHPLTGCRGFWILLLYASRSFTLYELAIFVIIYAI